MGGDPGLIPLAHGFSPHGPPGGQTRPMATPRWAAMTTGARNRASRSMTCPRSAGAEDIRFFFTNPAHCACHRIAAADIHLHAKAGRAKARLQGHPLPAVDILGTDRRDANGVREIGHGVGLHPDAADLAEGLHQGLVLFGTARRGDMHDRVVRSARGWRPVAARPVAASLCYARARAVPGRAATPPLHSICHGG